ncbi:MAG: hypothetical protein V1835_06890 [Candidatus Micrarchaeota archaeon]
MDALHDLNRLLTSQFGAPRLVHYEQDGRGPIGTVVFQGNRELTGGGSARFRIVAKNLEIEVGPLHPDHDAALLERLRMIGGGNITERGSGNFDFKLMLPVGPLAENIFEKRMVGPVRSMNRKRKLIEAAMDLITPEGIERRSFVHE